jgi:uncharacterized membrane protein
MTAAVLIGYVLVPLFGVVLWAAPLANRPTIQFGVRVPSAHATDAVLRHERRAYRWRSAAVAICATVAVIAIGGRASWWPSRLVLAVEILANLGCFWLAHQRITKVKSAGGWFAGQRQTVVADTSWRTDPPRFPVGWLLPAVAVIVATVIIGVLRYPHLPAYLDSGAHRVATSPARAFALIIGQVYVTALGTTLLLLVYRSRPDLDTADPAASLRGYRKALGAFARAALVLFACIDLTLLVAALQLWQILRLRSGGTVLVLLPVVLGLVAFFVTLVRAGRERARTTPVAGTTDRDDDRFWKGGLVYFNPDDPAVLVGARFAFGWTANFGNPTARKLVAGIVALPVGLVILKLATGI